MGMIKQFMDMKRILVLGGFCCLVIPAFSKPAVADRVLSLDKWTYIQVDNQRGKWGDWDEPDWLRYFGLAMTDVEAPARSSPAAMGMLM